MLSYVPGHSQLLSAAVVQLMVLGSKPAVVRSAVGLFPAAKRELEVTFLGAGPGPELYGLLEHYLRFKVPVDQVKAHFLDARAPAWAPSRSIIEKDLIPGLWTGNLELNPIDIDLTDQARVQSALDKAANSDLMVAQNFWNEFPDDATALRSFNAFASRMRLGQSMLIIDLSGYGNSALLQSFRTCSGIYGAKSDLVTGTLHLGGSPKTQLPPIVREHLMPEEEYLRPRSRINYAALVCVWN